MVDMLLPFLDIQSTLNLAQNHKVTRKILGSSAAWKKLIRRSCVSDQNFYTFEPKHEDAARLHMGMLKLMEDPKAHILDLLDAICQRFPENRVGGYFGAVTISCPTHRDSHRVLSSDFCLLEEIEGAFGTTIQDVVALTAGENGSCLEEPLLSTLSARLSRQQNKLTSICFHNVSVESKESAEAFKTVMQASPEITFTHVGLEVRMPIGTEGWRALAEGVSLHPGLRFDAFYVLKAALDGARREDMRVIWEALEIMTEEEIDGTMRGGISVELDPEKDDMEEIKKWKGEAGWSRLVQVMEMSKEEWATQFEKEGGADKGGGEVAAEDGEGDDEDVGAVDTEEGGEGDGVFEVGDAEEEDV